MGGTPSDVVDWYMYLIVVMCCTVHVTEGVSVRMCAPSYHCHPHLPCRARACGHRYVHCTLMVL